MNHNTKIRGRHIRAPWSDMKSDQIFVSTKYNEIKNGSGGDRGAAKIDQDLYETAKRQNNQDSAGEIAAKHFSDRVIDRVIDEIMQDLEAGRKIIVVHPQPCFNVEGDSDSSLRTTNAIPYACASLLADEIGAELNQEIIQVSRPGRTKLKKIERFLYQPHFEGDVDTKAIYVLIDDNCTLGGTLAMLRTHIVSSGGCVGAVCTLCSPEGVDQRFSVATDTLNVIKSRYGNEIDAFLEREIGHATFQLTENEGNFLANWQSNTSGPTLFDRLREAFSKTRAKG